MCCRFSMLTGRSILPPWTICDRAYIYAAMPEKPKTGVQAGSVRDVLRELLNEIKRIVSVLTKVQVQSPESIQATKGRRSQEVSVST